MDLVFYPILFVAALALLIKGSDWFIESAEQIGLALGISPYVIGVTIVAAGTSLPEMASSVAAIYQGESSIVAGNVVGSNIANVLLILGCVAVFGKAIRVDSEVVNVDLPILILTAFLMVFIMLDAKVSLIEALMLLVCLIIFLLNSFQADDDDEKLEKEKREKISARTILFLILGGVSVYFGADYTILAISKISLELGVTPDFIALTVVAFGTSLPELVVSLNAAKRGNTGIAVGNVVGSNIFNTCAVVGVARMFGDLEVPMNVTSFGLYFMLAITIGFGVMAWSNRITKWEGAIMLVMYMFFITELSKDLL